MQHVHIKSFEDTHVAELIELLSAQNMYIISDGSYIYCEAGVLDKYNRIRFFSFLLMGLP